LLLGNGDGTFQAPVSFAVGSNPVAIAVGNFTASGHKDVVVADKGDTNGNGAGVNILLGNGFGGFQSTGMISAGVAPVGLAVGDLNGDGKQDIAVADEGHSTSGVLLGDGQVQVLLGNGDGTFGPAAAYFGGAFGTSIALGNFHGNGVDDIAVGNGGATVNLLTGKGDGTFISATNFAKDLGTFSVATGDFNGDGITDIVTGSYDGVRLFLGNGDGTFQTPSFIPLRGSGRSVAAADLRHDGILDLMAVDTFGIEILLGNGDGTFKAPVTYTPGDFVTNVTIADLNGDGFPDLVSLGSRGSITVWLNDGAGAFQNTGRYDIGDETPSALAVGDFHGNGIPDLLVTGYKQEIDSDGNTYLIKSDINLFRGNGDGTFQPAVRQDVLRLGNPPPFLVAADFNGDGLPDLVFGAHILLNNGDGTFRDAGSFRTGSRVVYVALADINRDGQPDLVVVNDVATVSVLLGNGDGTFQSALNFAVGPLPGQVATGNFTGSGFPDLITANQGGLGSLTVLLNAADWVGPANRSLRVTAVASALATMSGSAHRTLPPSWSPLLDQSAMFAPLDLDMVHSAAIADFGAGSLNYSAPDVVFDANPMMDMPGWTLGELDALV
jgi:hypothetical protein